jgi:cation diffusion facilitator CzcD-associated flavoprotein CzcO
VLVCNGHHWQPKLPRFPGHFSGEYLHSHSYRSPEPWAGQRVLVVGIGNSGVDIACDLTQTATPVYLSTRRGAHMYRSKPTCGGAMFTPPGTPFKSIFSLTNGSLNKK